MLFGVTACFYHSSKQVPFQMYVPFTNKETGCKKLREGVDMVSGDQINLLNSMEECRQGAVPITWTQRGVGRKQCMLLNN